MTRTSIYNCSNCKQPFEKQFTGKQKANMAWEWINNGKSFCGNKCPNCLKEKFNEYRRNNKFAACKKYEKTKTGYLMRTYRNMLSRVRGILKKKAHLYGGLDILPKKEFYEWASGDKNFDTLFSAYSKSGYQMRLSPSINRIDSTVGYIDGNMEWITHSENSRLGSISKRNKPGAKSIDDPKAMRPVVKLLL